MITQIKQIQSDNPKVQKCISLFRLVEGYKLLAKKLMNMPNATLGDSDYFWGQSEIKEIELGNNLGLLTHDELVEYVEKTDQIIQRMCI